MFNEILIIFNWIDFKDLKIIFQKSFKSRLNPIERQDHII